MSAFSSENPGRAAAFSAAPAVPSTPSPAPERPVAEPEPPPSSGGSRGLIGLLLFLAGAAGGYWYYQAEAGKPVGLLSRSAERGPAVRMVRATAGDFRDTVRLSGAISAQSFAAIRAPQIRSGRSSRGAGLGGGLTIVAMAAPGSHVRKGEVVAEFDRQSQQQAIDDQQAAVVQARARIQSTGAQSTIDMEAKRQLLLTAKAEFEKAVLNVRTAEVRSEIEAEILRNTMQQAEAAYRQLEEEVELLAQSHAAQLRQAELDLRQEEIDLQRAELNADRLLIRTPLDGIVVMQTIFRGSGFSQVALGDEVFPGAYFMQVVDPGSMVLEAKANQADSQKIRVGQPAEVRLDAYTDDVWPGRVRAIAAMAGGGTGDGRSRGGTGDYVREIAVTVDILESSPRIIPDLSAGADVLLDSKDNVVMAPREALHRDLAAGDWFVWVRDAARAAFERRAVEVGEQGDTEAVIVAGLTAGEEVVAGTPPAPRR